MEQTEASRGLDFVLKELLSLHKDSSLSKGSTHRPLDRVLIELMAEKENSAVERAVAAEQRKQQSELMAEREKAANAIRLQQNDFQLRLQKQQDEFQAKLEKGEERLQERLEHERREHNLKQENLLARQDELIARHDQERVEAKASQEVLLHKILDNQRNLPPRDENQEGVILEQGTRQQTFFREVMQQLREEVKTLRHSESGKLIVCQGPVILKQPGDANRFRSSFDSIHSRRT